jgi:hypothetical protein
MKKVLFIASDTIKKPIDELESVGPGECVSAHRGGIGAVQECAYLDDNLFVHTDLPYK